MHKGHSKCGCPALGIMKTPSFYSQQFTPFPAKHSHSGAPVIFKPVFQPASRIPDCLNSPYLAKIYLPPGFYFFLKPLGLPLRGDAEGAHAAPAASWGQTQPRQICRSRRWFVLLPPSPRDTSGRRNLLPRIGKNTIPPPPSGDAGA